MALAHRATGAVAGADSGNLVVTLPANQLNDIITIEVVQHDNVASTIAGYTLIGSQTNGATMAKRVFGKRSNGAESNPTITHAAGAQIIACATVHSGVDSGLTIGVGAGSVYRDIQFTTGSSVGAGTFSLTAPALTGVVSGDMRIFMGASDQTDTSGGGTTNDATPPAGFNERIDNGRTNVTNSQLEIADLLASGSAGSLSSTWNAQAFNNPAWIGTQLALSSDVSASAAVLPTPPLPRAFQEQGAIYSGEITGFQPLAFQIPDPTRGFQENDAFQPQAFQKPDPTVAFQPEAFDGFTSFQMSVLAFQEPTGFQGDAFQEYAGLPRGTPRTIIVSNNGADESRDRFIRARQHRQARILRAPVQPPAAAQVVRPSISVTEDRRAARARTRRRKPILLRAPIVSAAPRKPVVETTNVSRTLIVSRLRRRKPQVLHAPLAAPVPRRPVVETATVSRTRVVARLRRRRPQILHAPIAAQPPTNRVQLHGRVRPKLARIRARKPVLLRAPSTPTPAPQTGIPVKRIFVYEDRRAAFVKARRRTRQILRAPSVPTPVPLVRVNVKVVQRKRAALVARLRHDQAIIRRAPVAAVRAPKQIVVRRQRRLQKKRSRAIILRSAPLWQRPGYANITVAKRKRQPLVARARRKLRYLASHVYGPPPPPPTDSGYGLLFLSDVPLYQGSASDVAVFQVGIADESGYALAFIDGSLYRVSIDDLGAGGSVSLSDIPGQ